MIVIPVGQRVLIKIKVEEKKTESGIILAESSIKKTNSEGTIVAVSKEVQDVKVGEVVLYEPWACESIDIEGAAHHLAQVKYLLAVIS